MYSVRTDREEKTCPFLRPFFFLLQDSSQIELLKELMDLQKDMIVMLLSLLEGSLTQSLLNNKQTECLIYILFTVTVVCAIIWLIGGYLSYLFLFYNQHV